MLIRKSRVQLLCLGLVLGLAVLAAACVPQGGGTDAGTEQITDMVGRQVELPAKIEGVVGLRAGALRLIAYLNATDLVVGVEDFEKQDNKRPYALANPELAALPSIGPQHGGDAELIMGQSPQVIFLTYASASDADTLQSKTGIPVIVINYGDLGQNRETFFDALRLMGRVLGRQDRAEELIAVTDSIIADLQQRGASANKAAAPVAYVGGIGFRGAQGLLSTKPAYEPFVFANVGNSAGDLGVEHAMISAEQLLAWDPDVIFVDQGGLALVMEDLKRPEYRYLTALDKGLVYGVLPFNYYAGNYATILADAYYIGSVLYLESFNDVNPVAKADEIYAAFVGQPVYKQMEEIFGGFKVLDLGD